MGERLEYSSRRDLMLPFDLGTNGIFIGKPALSLRDRRIFCSDPLGVFSLFVRESVSHPSAVPSALQHPP